MIALVRETAARLARMSDVARARGAGDGGGFDPERFFELARKVGHGRALGLEYRASATIGSNWRCRGARNWSACRKAASSPRARSSA